MSFSSQQQMGTISTRGVIRQGARGALAAVLCSVMVAPPAMLAEDGHAARPDTPSATKLTQDQQVLHALNRLTFGPRPGDMAAVQKMGLHAWIEQQLNPGKIDDSALEAKLASFPAMQLSSVQLMERFPNQQMIRQMETRGAGMPSDPTERAIYSAAMASYTINKGVDPAQQTQLKKAAKRGPVTTGDGSMSGGETMSAGDSNTAPGNDMAAGDTDPAANNMVSAVVGTDNNGGKRDGRADRREEFQGNVDAILALPPQERVSTIVALSGPQIVAFERAVKPRQRPLLMQGLTPAQVETLAALQGPVRVVGAETLETRLLRDVYSDRQLEAVMTDFWLNHFSVYVRKNQNEPYLLNSYERDTILPHAMGKFEDLLVATAQSPAMLMYLDNFQSIGPDSPAAQRGKKIQQFADKNPQRAGLQQVAQFIPKGINENYAREIIELHTYGVRCEISADRTAAMLPASCGGAGYTQADVTNLAKVLTGWTLDRPYRGGGGFLFDENRHERGDKVVLGKTIKDSGEKEGLEVLHMLATSPATAHFISHKLAVRFVSDNPPQALEDKMAATFLKTDGDIKQVLRTMFNAPEFWSPAVYRAKVKTPIEFLASALRASDANVVNALPLVQAMDRLGMPIYGMQTPNGYAWDAEPWVSTNALVSRMNFSLVMSNGLLPGTRTDWPKLLGEPETANGAGDVPSPAAEKQLEVLLIGQAASPNTRATVLAQAAKPGQAQEAQKNLSLAQGDGDGTGGSTGDSQMMTPDGSRKQNAIPRKGKGSYGAGGASFTDLAGNMGSDGPVSTMAGLLLGSPDFQRR